MGFKLKAEHSFDKGKKAYLSYFSCFKPFLQGGANMTKRLLTFFLALILFLSFPAMGTKVHKLSLDATHVLVGKVKTVYSYYDGNEWGDVLIFSRVDVKVEKKLKGKTDDEVSFVVEGGTVGEITLKVSNYPLFEEGEKIKLYLKKVDQAFRFLGREKMEAKGGKPGKPDKGPKGGGCCKTFAKWPLGSDVYYHIDAPNNDGLSNNCVINDIVAGANSWSDFTTGINLYYDNNPGYGAVFQNWINDIIMRPTSSGSAIAVTYTWYYKKGRQIIEFDMLFYDAAWIFFSLSCSPESCDGGFYVQTIATHEFGHGIGIDHNRCTTSIMYPYADWCMTNTLTAEDESCVINLYK